MQELMHSWQYLREQIDLRRRGFNQYLDKLEASVIAAYSDTLMAIFLSIIAMSLRELSQLWYNPSK